jgi:hypothetical protein
MRIFHPLTFQLSHFLTFSLSNSLTYLRSIPAALLMALSCLGLCATVKTAMPKVSGAWVTLENPAALSFPANSTGVTKFWTVAGR